MGDSETTRSNKVPPMLMYNPSSVPGLFRLRNYGFLCYMNGVVQALLSLSALNDSIRALHQRSPNRLTTAYMQLVNVRADPLDDIPLMDIHEIFDTLLANQKLGGTQLQDRSQQDAQELLILLLNAFGDGVKHRCEVRYSCDLECLSCHSKRAAGDGDIAKPELIVDMTDAESLCTPQDYQEYIRQHTLYPADFVCGCGAKNVTVGGRVTEPRVRQIYKLRRVGEIIIIMFKKYGLKRHRYFPQSLELPGMSGLFRYRAVAQIDHRGSTQSGHYTARSCRPKPAGYQQQRESLLQEQLDRQPDPQRQQAILAKLRDWRDRRAEPMAVFQFDDDIIRYVGAVEPVEETYMVAYHIESIRPIKVSAP